MKILFIYSLIVFLTSCVTVDRTNQKIKKDVRDQVLTNKSEENHSLKRRVVVLPLLDSDSGRPESLRLLARQALIMDLNKSGEVIALDSSELNLDISKYFQKGEYQLSQLSKESSKMGAPVVLEGKIIDIKVKRKADAVGIIRQMKSTFEVSIRVRMVSGRAGNEIFNTIKTVSLEEANYRVAERVDADKFLENNPQMIEVLVKDAFLEFVPQIIGAVGKVAWEGRIAAINGDRFYLNIGKISGVQLGDLLKVTDESDDVYDPETGSHIGKVPGRLKGTLEVVSYFGNDGSIAILHSGSGFKENDKVEMY